MPDARAAAAEESRRLHEVDLQRFAMRFRDLGDQDVMRGAWS